MKPSEILRKALLIWVAFIAADLVAGVILPAGQANGPPLVWASAQDAIVVAALTLLVASTSWRGLRLALALSSVPFAIAFINIIEGVVYLKSAVSQPLAIIAFFAVKYAFIIPLWIVLFRPPAGSPRSGPALPRHTIAGMLWRFALCDFIYLMLYFAAGMLVYPLVRDFYAQQTMPSLGLIIALQLLLRGPVLVGIGALLTRMIGRQRFATAIMVGLVLMLTSGVAPLIAPNPVFPDAVRWAHFCEVTSANFILGGLVALIWLGKSTVSP